MVGVGESSKSGAAIAREIAVLARFRKILIFLALIETTVAFTRILQEERIHAAHVDGYGDS
jgi:hypothetical protein